MQATFLPHQLPATANRNSTKSNPASHRIFREVLVKATGSSTVMKSPGGISEPGDRVSKRSSRLDTDKKDTVINLDSHYSNTPPTKRHHGRLSGNDLPPILLPSVNNIQQVARHASARLRSILTDYNIPAPPSHLTYDNYGKMRLPADFPYAKQLQQALADNPGLARELRDLNAMASHYVMMGNSIEFTKEIYRAEPQQEVGWIRQQHSHLLEDDSNSKRIALTFSKEGSITIYANGKPVQLV